MNKLSVLLVIVGVLFGLNEAHRHHLNHHGKHYHNEHRLGRKHHKGSDVGISVAELSTPKNETISIDVVKKLKGSENGKSFLKVSLRVHAIKGVVHINGRKIDHSVVTSLHIRTVVDEASPNGKSIKKPAIVQVRVMVTETKSVTGMRMLAVQEEIIEVDDDEVDQIDIKEIVLELGNGIQERKRSVTVIQVQHSKIHKQPRKGDKHLWARKGKLPKDPFCLSKHEMRRWHHRHMSWPNFELGRNNEGGPNDDDDDDHKKHNRKHHHHGFKHWSHKFCAWFHKLPVATRAAFGISVALFGILIMAACWTCCCKKRKASRESKYEMADTASVDIQCEDPLYVKKKPLDEQPLVA